MPTGNEALIEIIRQTIRSHGPQSFDWFMQQALYHPEHGYYASGRARIGRKGDYFTNVSVGPLFGKLLAAQFKEIWEQLGRIDPPSQSSGAAGNFLIVEQGAHDGQFACDVLGAIQEHTPKFFAALRYRIIEPFAVWKDRQRQNLGPFRDKVEWRDALEPFTGIHFSNELLDAMPVRLFENGMEKFIDIRNGEFVLLTRESKSRRPFNQAALDWIDNVAAKLQRGYILTIDYGRECSEPPRDVQVRAQHRHLDSPLEQIGEADITAPVDWTGIISRASQAGLDLAGFTDQHHFLTGILSTWPDLLARVNPKMSRELKTLLHPEMLGRSFHVLALSKNVNRGLPLAGFQLAGTLSR